MCNSLLNRDNSILDNISLLIHFYRVMAESSTGCRLAGSAIGKKGECSLEPFSTVSKLILPCVFFFAEKSCTTIAILTNLK